MSMGSVWASGSWANPSWATGSWASLGVEGLVLVDSPTRLLKMRRTAKAGDTLYIAETLKGYDGTAQDLTDATVTFTLVPVTGGTPAIDRGACTVVNATAGTVTFSGDVPDTAGVYLYEFEATWADGTDLTFPNDANGELTVVAQLA